FDNNSGTITAIGAGSEVQLVAGATVTGGLLTTSGGGVIRTPTGNTASLSNLTNIGTFITDNGADTFVSGTIINNGSMSFNSAGNLSRLVLGTDTVLIGSGTITLSGANAQITGGHKLDNVNSLIQGEGNIGANAMTLLNENAGLVSANVTGHALLLDPSNAGS